MKRKEEEKNIEDIENKAKEIQEKKKEIRRKGGPAFYYSYDQRGKSVEVKQINEFPDFLPKCIPASKEGHCSGTKIEEKSSLEYKKKLAQSDLRTIDPKSRKTEKNLLQIPSKNSIMTGGGLYEALIPVNGVTFLEDGKNPKKSLQTISEVNGKFNKTEYYSFLHEASANSSIFQGNRSMANLLPDIKKPDQNSSKIPPLSIKQVVNNEKTTKEKSRPPSKYNTSRSEQTESRLKMEASSIVPIDISSQLIVQTNTSIGWHHNENSISLYPKKYIPPTFRRSESASRTADIGSKTFFNKNPIDTFNSAVADGEPNLPNTCAYGPIARGTKSTTKLMRESLGFLKKHPRDRFINTRCGIRLPPPPIGRTLGHGIVKI